MRLCVDDTRHILYVLTINGSIQVFDLGDKGTTISKVASLTYGQIQVIFKQLRYERNCCYTYRCFL